MKHALRRSLNRLLHTAVTTLHHRVTVATDDPPNDGGDDSTDVISALMGTRFDAPVLSHGDVTDYGSTGFVADPFLFRDSEGRYHLFFEVFSPTETPTASIGHAVSDDGGDSWSYDRIVFRTDRHVSFPYVFSEDDEVYLLPDLSNDDTSYSPARLYRATEFPTTWAPVADIVDADHQCLDTVVFEYDGTWWAVMGGGDNDELRVYFGDTLTAPDWSPHPENPVVTDRKGGGRPAGRPVVSEDSITMFFQDCRDGYGNAVNAYEVVRLTETEYEDRREPETPVLSGVGGVAWNSGRMHHVDAQVTDGALLFAVDGDVGWGRNQYTGSLWSIGFESVATSRDV